ncbi:MAG: aldehyde dehydrogenase family protein [Rhodocyclaceae bacterium]
MSPTYTTAPDTLTHWIDGRPVAATGERSAEVFDPALGRVARTVGLASVADVDAAVASAARAQVEWGALAPQRRARVLFRMKALVEQHTVDLARLDHLRARQDLSRCAGRESSAGWR